MSRSYTYTPLANVEDGKQYNVFGVVKFFKPPYKTRGTGHALVCSITDPSLANSRTSKLKCLFFENDANLLPPITKVGDVVRFHRLKVVKHGPDLQGQRGNGFSCLVFDGEADLTVSPKSTTTKFTFCDDDKAEVVKLREWWRQQVQASRNRLLRNVDCGGIYFDLVCQVIGTCELTPHECILLKVWDGTRIVCSCRTKDVGSDPDLHYTCDAELARAAGDLAVDVYIFDNHTVEAYNVKPKDYVLLKNLHIIPASEGGPDTADTGPSYFQLVMHGGMQYNRGLAVLAIDDPRTITLQGYIRATAKDRIEQGQTSGQFQTCAVTSYASGSAAVAATTIADRGAQTDDREAHCALHSANSLSSADWAPTVTVSELLKSARPGVKYAVDGHLKLLASSECTRTTEHCIYWYCPRCLKAVCLDEHVAGATDSVVNQLLPFDSFDRNEVVTMPTVEYAACCPRCNDSLVLYFVLVFALSDDSASMNTVLWSYEAETFFGMTAKQALTDADRELLLQRALFTMELSTVTLRINVKCCDTSRHGRIFEICDTVLLHED